LYGIGIFTTTRSILSAAEGAWNHCQMEEVQMGSTFVISGASYIFAGLLIYIGVNPGNLIVGGALCIVLAIAFQLGKEMGK
jgi:hypothetical protein